MGREVKRVHIDFDWYKGINCCTRVWPGYLLDPITCPLCNGVGLNSSGKECPLCYGEPGKIVRPKIEPPKGYDFENTSGYQIWENTSEGSPVSPVFLKPKDLAKWMVENDDSITKDTTYEGWLKFIKEEKSAPTMVLNKGRIKSGVCELTDSEEEKLIPEDKKEEVKREN